MLQPIFARFTWQGSRYHAAYFEVVDRFCVTELTLAKLYKFLVASKYYALTDRLYWLMYALDCYKHWEHVGPLVISQSSGHFLLKFFFFHIIANKVKSHSGKGDTTRDK